MRRERLENRRINRPQWDQVGSARGARFAEDNPRHRGESEGDTARRGRCRPGARYAWEGRAEAGEYRHGARDHRERPYHAGWGGMEAGGEQGSYDRREFRGAHGRLRDRSYGMRGSRSASVQPEQCHRYGERWGATRRLRKHGYEMHSPMPAAGQPDQTSYPRRLARERWMLETRIQRLQRRLRRINWKLDV